MRRMWRFLFVSSFSIVLLGCGNIIIGTSPTPTSTEEATPIVEDPTVTPSAVIPATATTIAAATATSTPQSTAPANVIVIEGPVEEINLNIITIANTKIEVNINDPILTLIEVGDVISLEGTPTVQNNIVIINAINIVSIQKNVIIIDNGTNPLPEGCKITKKGKIKCTKKKTKKS